MNPTIKCFVEKIAQHNYIYILSICVQITLSLSGQTPLKQNITTQRHLLGAKDVLGRLAN